MGRPEPDGTISYHTDKLFEVLPSVVTRIPGLCFWRKGCVSGMYNNADNLRRLDTSSCMNPNDATVRLGSL